jgi:RNA polymerase sigma-70 factor (ECF subfamily)
MGSLSFAVGAGQGSAAFPDPGRPAYMNDSVGEDAPAVPEKPAEAIDNGVARRRADEASITELYRKYSPSLYWVCMRYTRNSEDAEDMVHQVFVKVQQNLAGFRGQSNVYTWMYRIAVNECIQMFRKRKFETDGESLPDLDDRVPIFPERELDAKLVLEKIMGGTDPKTVEILFLLYLEGLKQEEVADVLKISRTTINRKVTAFKSRMERFKW